MSYAVLQIRIFLYQSIDHYCPDPGDEATFYGGHKITVLIWSDSIRRLESL